MQGEFFKGNINDVCEELKRIGEQNKGKTVAEVLRQRRYERLKNTVDKQLEELIKRG